MKAKHDNENFKVDENFKVNENFSISKPRKFTPKNKNAMYFFNLNFIFDKIQGTIYNFKILENTKTQEYFISPPSKKGEDERYHNVGFFKFDEEVSEKIMEVVVQNASD